MSPVFLILFAAGIIIFLFIVAFIQLVVYLVRLARPIKKQLDARRPVYDPELYKSRDWKALVYLVIKKAGGKCYMCGGKAETAHHLTYKYGIICDPKYLMAICWPCHNNLYDPARKQIRERIQDERIQWN
jgi:hypothetical protein